MQALCLHNATIFTGITTIEEGSLIIKDGLIDDVVSSERLKRKKLPKNCRLIDLNGHYIAPGFIDTHIHGLAGYDTAGGTVDDFLGIAQHLVKFGVTSFCPTLYPQPKEAMLKAIDSGQRAIGRESGGARINGLNLEGPFISPQRLGAQRPEAILEVDLAFMRQMYKAGKGAIKIMTVAPELKNMRELALYCLRKGIILAAGHSDASYDNMLEGVQAGIFHCTHLFNAMRKLHHRDPGLVGAILIHEDLSCEIIADGLHVHPALIKMLLRDKDYKKVLLITDALAPTGLEANQKPLFANGEEVYLGPEGLWRQVKDDVIAGSNLTMDKAVRNMVSWGYPKEQVLRMASTGAAHLLKLNNQIGYLLPSHRADIVVLNKQLQVKQNYVDGKLVYSN
ncbi:MAG: N-acetylglucosamine-6-phosphate deacetylase [Spirochaetaceae bacterium]|nr:N-acetylglucosamine-6-phosphate deacetylase [Spirochaetaceae bacterium]